MEGRRGNVAALAVLAALVLFLFRDAVFLGQSLFERDIHAYWGPQVASLVRSIAAGSPPLWNPNAGFGQPYLANPSTQVLYPFTWLNVVLLPATYYTLFVVAHLVFAGYGVYRLARTLGLGHGAGLTGAALFVTSGPLLSLVNLWHHFAGATFIPWVLLAGERACVSRERKHALVWGGVMAAQILAGSADMCALAGLLALANGLRHVEWRDRLGRGNRLLLGRAFLASAFALGLTAAQWLPTLELATRSARWALDPANRSVWSVDPRAAVQFLFPILFDELPFVMDVSSVSLEVWQPFIHSLYLGLPALGLVAAAPARGRLARLVGGAALLAALIALGRHTPVYEIAVTALPPLRILRYPSKISSVIALLWALLAAMGFEAWRERAAARRGLSLPVVVPLAVLVALAWGCVATAYAGGAQGLPALLAANASRLWMAALGGSAVLLAALAGARAAPLVAVLAVADLVVAHGDLNPTAPASVLAARPEVLERIERTPSTRLYVWDYGVRTRTMKSRYDMLPVLAETPSGGPRPLGKMLALNAYLYPPLPGRWGLSGSYDPDFLGLDPGPLASLNLLLRVVEGTPAWGRLLRVGSVDYVIALHTEGQEELVHVATVRGLFSRPIELFRNPAPLPRTYAVGTSRIADGDDALRALVDPQFDPEREVVLASGPRLAAPAFRGTSRLLESRPDHVVLETDFESEGLAVLVDGYDPGWSAALDGAATPVYRANVAFRAVRAPAGRHRIELRYRPRSVAIGLALGAASLLAAALLLRARS